MGTPAWEQWRDKVGTTRTPPWEQWRDKGGDDENRTPSWEQWRDKVGTTGTRDTLGTTRTPPWEQWRDKVGTTGDTVWEVLIVSGYDCALRDTTSHPVRPIRWVRLNLVVGTETDGAGTI